MDLFEYQARDMFEKYGVPVLAGRNASTPDRAGEAAVLIGARSGGLTVVKAQVKTGGRGKAGGVKLAHSPAEARALTEQMLGMDINGHTVHTIMVAEGAKIVEEYYFSLLLDRANRQYLAICSKEGGMDIERLAVERPEALARIAVDPEVGIDYAKAAEIVNAAGFDEDVKASISHIIRGLWVIYRDEDATLVEVNPLVKLADGRVVALDGKVTLDDNARFRQPNHAFFVDELSEDPLEAKAKEKHLNYVKLDGNVGIIGNGAGLVMSTLDVVAYAGEDLPGKPHPANFLDIGGGASAQVMADGLHIILGDPQVKSVFVNVFGGITSCDAVANGIVGALDALGDEATKPLVVRIDGNNVAEGRRILAERNHPLVTIEDTMDGAARKAAELAASA